MNELHIYQCHNDIESLNCSEEQPCVRKCCPEGWEVTTNSTCRERKSGRNPWSPSFYEMSDDGDCVHKLKKGMAKDIQYEIGTPENCDMKNRRPVPSKNIPGEYGLGR